MANSPSNLNILRTKSRSLLSRLADNSRLVEDEIRKLRINRVTSSREYTSEPIPSSSSWKIRNDSSVVNDLLHSRIPHESEMLIDRTGIKGGRIQISSKHVGCTSVPRKPVSGCYCNRKPKKVRYRSPNTISRPFEPCHHCKSHVHVFNEEILNPEDVPLSPTLSCDTLQKVRSITYTPRSEFLRRVQRQVSHQFISERSENAPDLVPSSGGSRHLRNDEDHNHFQDNAQERQEPRESGGGSNSQRNRSIGSIGTQRADRVRQIGVMSTQSDSTIGDPQPRRVIEVPIEVHRADTSSITQLHRDDSIVDRSHRSRKDTGDSVSSEYQKKRLDRGDLSPEIETIFPPRLSKSFKGGLKKTISSTKSADSGVKEGAEKREKVVRTLSQRSCCDAGCAVNERRRVSRKRQECAECCSHGDRCLSHFASEAEIIPGHLEKQSWELRKFREKNYFDTHESSRTVPSCGSSESMEQFELNSRLFPEPVGRLFKDNIVVSMPACVTTELKRIHYFPRSIVKEAKREISDCDKKKHKSCPLTGHAIDVRVLRPPFVGNSLALKYQRSIR